MKLALQIISWIWIVIYTAMTIFNVANAIDGAYAAGYVLGAMLGALLPILVLLYFKVEK